MDLRAAGQSPIAARREARLVALCVDGMVLVVALAAFVVLGALTVLLQTNWLEVDPSRTEWAWGYAVSALWIVVPLIYFSAGGVGSGTVGARLLGLRVVRSDGERAGAGRAVARAALLYPSVLLLGGGLLWSVVDGRGRTLHDRLSGTMVVETA